MQAYAAAAPLTFDHADEPRSRPAVALSVQDRSDVRELEKRESGHGPRSRNHQEVGVGTVVVAIALLAFYAVATVGADVSPTHHIFVGLDIFEMHQTIRNLPAQKIHDMSVVFSNAD
jgi:hypothetical protein